MKNHSMVALRLAVCCLAAGAFVLVSTAAFAAQKPAHKAAQTHPAANGQSAAAPNPSGHAKSIAVDHAGGNGVRTMDHGNTGTGAHPAKADEKGATGVNPVSEDKDKTVAKPDAKPSRNTEPVEYKDPEDMTTRYRPGNNKTTAKSNPKASKGADSPH